MTISNTIYHKSKHLSEAELLPLKDNHKCCLLCRSKILKEVWVLQREPYISLQKCGDCSAVSASRIPTAPTLDNYYSEYYTGSTDREVHTLGAPSRLARCISNQFSCTPDQPVSILDFGGGDGAVAYLLAIDLVRRGVNSVSVTVVDYEKRTISSALNQISIEKKNTLEDIPNKYSIVIASAVIEHYPYPKDLLNKLLDLVEIGGLFYARTPYMLPLMKLLARFGIRLDFTFPGHLFDFGEEFWRKIFAKSIPNFKLIVSRPSMVETTFVQDFLRTLIAYIAKAPWYVLRKNYRLVGGWEIFAVKMSTYINNPRSV